jgi:hypothetical protein
LTANTGYIGTAASGWVIAAGQITSTNIGMYAGAANTARIAVGTGSNLGGLNSANGATDMAFWAGSTHASRDTAPFRVAANGVLYASGATVGGTITANAGSIVGDFYAGGNAIRLSTDGQRFVLPNITSVDVPTSSSALRWFPTIDGTHDNSKNYTGLIGYRHTSLNTVDMLYTSFVGSGDYSTYDARMILQAGHHTGSVYTDARLEVLRQAGAGGTYVIAYAGEFQTSAVLNVGTYAYIAGNCSAESFTDRTPYYDGDAVADLRKVKGRGGGIDHQSLPQAARKTVKGKNGATEDGRDIGAMISILTKAVQQLDARLIALEK